MTVRSIVVAAGLLALLLALTYRLGSPPLFDDPNDAQYAEVAREMVETGDWLSPQLDYVLFLNKPPLLYWLIASSYTLFGVSELAARVPGVLVTLLAIFLLYRLGCELFDSTTAAIAASIYATLPSTLLEARFVRPDSLLTAATIGALLAFAIAIRSDGAERQRALLGLQCSLAVGLLAKGIVGLLLPGFPIAVVILIERRWDLLADFARPRGWFLFAGLVVPWHFAVALRHPGFASDYIVNQHVLFFLDKKEPRDSIPISLGEFWGAFLLRTFPWTLFLPLAAFGVCRVRDPRRFGRALIVAWAGGILLLFSAATSRLEHYVLPALPAVALWIGTVLRNCVDWGATWRRSLAAHFFLLASAAVAAAPFAPRALSGLEWLSDRAALPGIARWFFALVAIGSAASLLASHLRPLAVGPLLCAALLGTLPLMHAGLVVIAPINSTALLAATIQSTPGADEATIVCEAPIEYQSCAGLSFYLRRRIKLLKPPGFVAPPYLAPHIHELFIEPPELERRWSREPILFISDPLAPMTRTLHEIVPAPFFIIARTNNRWLISNSRLR
jgi:4-amino-4-deoxy-L-arabinose transferase-like glycosyltransferase